MLLYLLTALQRRIAVNLNSVFIAKGMTLPVKPRRPSQQALSEVQRRSCEGRNAERQDQCEAINNALRAAASGCTNEKIVPGSRSLWTFYGSTFRLIANGQNRRFIYETPRPGLAGAVQKGTILFDGMLKGIIFRERLMFIRENATISPTQSAELYRMTSAELLCTETCPWSVHKLQHCQ